MIEPGLQRYRLVLQYFGGAFRGTGGRPSPPTVGSVQESLERACDAFVGPGNHRGAWISSRTDAGVHALRNMAHVDLRRLRRQTGDPMPHYSGAAVARALNAHLANPHLRVIECDAVREDWAARRAAAQRVYRYYILHGAEKADLVFRRDSLWCLEEEVDVARMRRLGALLAGRRDFGAFRARGCQAQSSWRTVDDVRVRELGLVGSRARVLEVTVVAKSFLYQMVRRIVGALVLGTEAQVAAMLEQGDAYSAPRPQVAPAHGLFLIDVVEEGGAAKEAFGFPLLLCESGADRSGPPE